MTTPIDTASPGSRAAVITAMDVAGNKATAKLPYSVRTIDTSITGGSRTATGNTFSFAGSPVGVGFECRVDADTFAACTSPFVIAEQIGAHSFEVRAVFTGASDQTPAFRTFLTATPRDRTRPTISITDPVAPVSLAVGDPAPALTLARADAGGSAFDSCFVTIPITTGTAGTRSARAIAWDRAGNSRVVTLPYTVS